MRDIEIEKLSEEEITEKTKQKRCKRCGRLLKKTEAIVNGYGATCWRKMQEEAQIKRRLF